MPASTTKDIYSRVTEHIVRAIEAGTDRWRMPWHVTSADSFSPVNVSSKQPYRGINVLSLWAAAEERGYTSGLWGTYKQWQEAGAHVKAQEKASPVVFWKVSKRDEQEQDAGETKNNKRFVARGYWVFNVAQVEGFQLPKVPKLPESDRVKGAEAFFSSLGADIRHGRAEAYYERRGDFIQLPDFEAFETASGYYSTVAHEVTHWSGATKRLARDLSGRFGSNAYAAEELVAELGAAFMMAKLGLSSEPRPDHAAYIATWLSLFKNDSRAIFTAASKAQQAVDWLGVEQQKVLSPKPQESQATVRDANLVAQRDPGASLANVLQPFDQVVRREPMAARKLTSFQDNFLTVTLWQGESDSPTKEDLRVTFRFHDKEITLPSEHLPSLARAVVDTQTLIEHHRQQIPFEKFYQENNFEFASLGSTPAEPESKAEPNQLPASDLDQEFSATSEPEPDLY